jgi:sialidase-1
LTIIRPTTINARFSQPVGLGGEKLWLCPTLGGDRLDLSGNGNHGTYYGGMGTVALTGFGGDRAFDFDGVNDRIDCPSDTFGGSAKLSMSCWVYQDSHDSVSGQGFMGQYDGSGATTDRVAILWSPASASGKAVRSLVLTNTLGSFAEAYWGSPPPPLNAWHHWCMTADGSEIRLYKDGILVDQTAYSGSPPTSPSVPFEIGRYRGGGNNNNYCLNGKVDDARVFRRALSPSEVKHLASKRGVLGSPRQPYDPLKRTVVRVPAGITFKPYWAKQSTQVAGLLK